MKKYFPLSPPIELIEKRLFGVTEGLIEAVERGETSRSIAEAVRNSPEWISYQTDIKEDQAGPEFLSQESPTSTAIPDHIRDLIQRRVAANSLATSALPVPGQIVSVEKIITPQPWQFDAVMQAPLYVLLDAQAETPDVWHGWLVSAETDYASWWDFVLQEQDAPFDPEAAMVQVWNPVRLYLPMAVRVVGRLSPGRLQAVRALAADFVLGELPADIPCWPGRVASRTTTLGSRVTTGSPLINNNDPRYRYQDLYFEAAEAVREPARLAMRAFARSTEPSTAAVVEEKIRRYFSGLGDWLGSIVPSQAMGRAASATELMRVNLPNEGYVDFEISRNNVKASPVHDINSTMQAIFYDKNSDDPIRMVTPSGQVVQALVFRASTVELSFEHDIDPQQISIHIFAEKEH